MGEEVSESGRAQQAAPLHRPRPDRKTRSPRVGIVRRTPYSSVGAQMKVGISTPWPAISSMAKAGISLQVKPVGQSL
jgi:hypothetical protein